ncbi:TRAP transporter small permease [Chelativorans multitrophicus]|nr:TRAP transporter small permease [Chelativorans multitrophicus]
MLMHILLEILLRSFFASSTFVLDEFVGYAMVALTFLGLGPTYRRHGHLRVMILLNFLNSSMKSLVEVVLLTTAITISTFIALYFAEAGSRYWTRGILSRTIAEVPLWIPMAVAVLGLVIFAVQAISSILLIVTGLVSGDELQKEVVDV